MLSQYPVCVCLTSYEKSSKLKLSDGKLITTPEVETINKEMKEKKVERTPKGPQVHTRRILLDTNTHTHQSEQHSTMTEASDRRSSSQQKGKGGKWGYPQIRHGIIKFERAQGRSTHATAPTPADKQTYKNRHTNNYKKFTNSPKPQATETRWQINK